VQAYPELTADHALLDRALAQLQVYPGRKRLANWRELANAGRYTDLAEEVLQLHYDPSYARSARRNPRDRLGEVELASLDEAEQDRAAVAIIDRVRRAFGGL
jgi:tRNA 2-selenouridine synthase